MSRQTTRKLARMTAICLLLLMVAVTAIGSGIQSKDPVTAGHMLKNLEPPVITSVTRLNGTAVVLAFTPMENADAYHVYRSRDGSAFIPLAQVSRPYYYDRKAASGREYAYYVVAEAAVNTSHAFSRASDVQPVGWNARPVTNVAVINYNNFFTEQDMIATGYYSTGSTNVKEVEADLRYLRDNGVRTITCSELVQYWEGTLELPERCVMITVDDGHYSIYKYLVPLLKEYGCKANISVVGDFADRAAQRKELPQRNYFMNWEEVAELAQLDFLDIGVHSYYMHRRVENGRQGSQIMENESAEEYRTALQGDARLFRQKLSSVSGYKPLYYMYPYGDLSWESLPILAEEGFQVFLAGNSPHFSPTLGNSFAFGVANEQLETRVLRTISRKMGDSLAGLLETVWNNTPETFTQAKPAPTPGETAPAEGQPVPVGSEITTLTRLNDKAVAMTYSAPQGTVVTHAFRSGNGRDFARVATLTDPHFYDWDAPAGKEYSYFAVSEYSDGGKPAFYGRSGIQAVGYNARPVTNVAALMYHKFQGGEETGNESQYETGSIKLEELEADLRYFRDNGIRTITCRELVDYWNGVLELPERCVMITVDDGHYSVYKYLAPLLQQYGCKANVAIIGEVADLAANRTETPQQYYSMNWAEIAELGKLEYLDIGIHSYDLHSSTKNGRHGSQMMEGESLEDYRAVLQADVRRFEQQMLGVSSYDPIFYVYPYGDLSWESIPILRDEGCKVLLAGNSPQYSPTTYNSFIFGAGEKEQASPLIRRVSRRTGDDIASVLDLIWSGKTVVPK